ncbi:MAG: RloB domain-containing protein, partial [Bacteroidaceae bacterium]
KRYFIRTNLHKYLTENGDLKRAVYNSEKICQLCKESPEDLKAYSEIHKVVELLNSIKGQF